MNLFWKTLIVLLTIPFLNIQSQTAESNAPELPAEPTVESQETNEPVKEPHSSGLSFNPKLTPKVQDGAYERITHDERIALPLPTIREADVGWSKRIWRLIDTQEKMNVPFTSEYNPLIEVLLEVADKNLDVQLFTDDSFTELLPKEEVAERLAATDSIEVYNFETEDYEMQEVQNDLDLTSFDKFRIKEDWVFDRKNSQMVVRIIGIAPVRKVIDPETGLVRGNEVLFWMHYPSVRQHLAKYESFNPENDAITVSWSHMFDGRIFSSYIIKESNPMDRSIEEYMAGREALLESEEIKAELMDFELDLWEY